MPKDQARTTKRKRASTDGSVKPPRKKGVGAQKQVSSPKATGARGITFEHRVQAVRLLAMCTELPCVGVPEGFTISKLIFQGRVHGHNTDDLVLKVVSPSGESGTLRMQMKRTLTPTTKNGVFEEAIGLAWLDFSQATFCRGLDTNLIVYQIASAKSMDAAVEVVNLAISSSDSVDWEKKVHAERFSNERNREAYAAIKAAAELYNNAPISLDNLHQFAVHLKFIHHDLDSDSTGEAALQKQILAMANVPNTETSNVWARLVHTCAELNGLGGDIELSTVALHLGDQLSSSFQAFRALRRSLQLVQGGGFQSKSSEEAATAVGTFLPSTEIAHNSASSYPDAVPAARPSSLNKLFSRQLDSINDLQKECRYADALAQIRVLGQDMRDIDDHQRARWYLMRGMCRWHLDDDAAAAADDFIKAATFCDDEDKFAAAKIRGHMLNDEATEALASAQAAMDRFPESFGVWLSATNARILNGLKLTSKDIPLEHVNQAAAWQMLAISQERSGDLVGAVGSARIALTKAEASFFTKDLFLRLALQFSAQNNLNIGLRMLPAEQRSILQEAANEFSDGSVSVWDVQSPKAQLAVLIHLGYAYLLVGRPEDALDLIKEARARCMADDGALFRVEIEALRDLGRPQEALARFEGALPKLLDDALVAYGQAAMLAKDLRRLESAQAEVARRTFSPDADRLQRALRMMRWELLLREGNSEKVRAELTESGFTPGSYSISDLVFAARAYRAPSGDEDFSRKCVDRVVELLQDSESPDDAYVGAQLLLSCKRYSDAAEIYGRILPASSFSDLHVDLLFCYLRTGQRARARDLLQTMPPNWRRSEDARHLALELCQSAGDWLKMIEFAKEDIAIAPSSASGWLLLLQATANVDHSGIGELIGETPDKLNGSIREIAQLAGIEIQYGYVQRGLKRLYRNTRSRLGDVDAAALHLQPILLIEQATRELDEVPEMIESGTSVELTDEQGVQRRFTIDPEGLEELPITEEFITPDSANARLLLGFHLYDSIEVPNPFGGSKTYKVTKISSAYRRLIEISYNSVASALIPTKHMTAVTFPTLEDGSLDISIIRDQLERRREYATQTLELYRQHPAPLGIIARRLGCDVMDLVRSWPHTGPKLEVCSGWQENHLSRQELLSNEAVWVADLAILTELATLGHLEVLKHLPRVLVSSLTRNAIDCKLEETSIFRNSGSMFSHEGQLGFHENTQEEWLNERELLQLIAKALDDYCEVMPSYGPENVEPSLHRMNEILSGEDYSTLLLCLEHEASLLTLDARFGKVASLFGVQAVSPQELLFFMVEEEKISPLEYSLAVIKMLFWRRTFVSVRMQDLVAMVDQGGSWLTIGVNNLREYLGDPNLDFESAVPVVLNFIAFLYWRGNCEYGVVLELIECLIEPLLRHKACRPEWILYASSYLWSGLGLGPEDKIERGFVQQYLGRALERAQHPMREVAVKATVYYGTVIPSFVSGVVGADDVAPNGEVHDEKRHSIPEDTPATFAVEGEGSGTFDL